MSLFSEDKILYLMGNGFRVYVLFLFFGIFLAQLRLRKSEVILGFFSFFILNSLAFLYFKHSFLDVAVNLLLLFSLTFLYDARIKQRIFSVLLISVLDLACESFIYWILTKILGGSHPTTDFIAPDLLLLFFVVSFQKRTEIKHGNRISLWQLFCIIFIPISSIVVVAAILWEMPNNTLDVATTAIILLMNVAIFRLSDVIEGYYRREYQLAVQQRQREAYENQMYLQRDVDQWLKQFQHDAKNHLIVLQQLVDSRCYEELSQYIAELNQRVEVNRQHVQSCNFVVDSILNVKLQEASQLGTELKLDINVPQHLPISDIDLNIILGNLLDNSIRALPETSVRRLSVKLEYDRNTLFIGISNTYGGADNISERNGILLTTKRSKQEHGIGLTSVRTTVEKYQGCLNLRYDDSCFFATVLLYLEENQGEQKVKTKSNESYDKNRYEK